MEVRFLPGTPTERRSSVDRRVRPVKFRRVAQLVARSVRDAEAPGSSPGSPTEIYGVKDLAEGSIAPLVTCESNLEQQSEVSRYEIPEFHIPSAPTNYLILIE